MKNLTEITIKHFNRHEIFIMSDLELVNELILIVGFKPQYDNGLDGITNHLFGLFDGYLYNDLLIRVSKVKEIPSSTLIKFNSLIKKIETNINK